MEYYFIKLIPPRQTFPQDITKEEANIMKEHGVYWRGLMEKGVAIVFGPVLDPNGVWGAGIIQVNDASEVDKYTSEDPAIKSGLNKLEFYPMKAVVKN
jgi:hypothetical protein